MQILFISIVVGGSAYFLIQKRRFDYFSLAFFSALVYFLPGFFGVTSYHVAGKWRDTPLHPEAYGIMIAVISSIWFFAWLSTYIRGPKGLAWESPAADWFPPLLLLVGLAGLMGLLVGAGNTVLDPNKTVVMQNLGRWHILYYTAITLGMPIAFSQRKYFLTFLFFLCLLFELYIGFRSSMSIAVLSIVVLTFYEKGRVRLISANWKMLLLAVAFGLLMFVYKQLAFAVKAGMWDVVSRILTKPQTYYLMLRHSEPFLVQQTLNAVVSQRFETSAQHILSSLYQLMLFAPELGADDVSFNSLFQPALFPGVKYGLAANIWAQMWSAGGWLLLTLFILFFNLVLALGNTTLRAKSPLLRAALAPAFSYWAFYLHRNELGYALNLEKRLVLLFLFVLLLTRLIHPNRRNAMRSAARRRQPPALDRAGVSAAVSDGLFPQKSEQIRKR